MGEELTEFQKRLLRFLRKEATKSGGSACYLDAFFEDLPTDQTVRGRSFYLKEIGDLEKEGYIETVHVGYTKRRGMKFGCYKLTDEGLKVIGNK